MSLAKQKNPAEIWEQTTKNLEIVISPQNYTNWIQPIQFSHYDDQSSYLYLIVPNQFFKEWLEDNYIDMINGALSVITEKNIQVLFIINEKKQNTISETTDISDLNHPETDEATKKINHYQNISILNPRYTFDQFVSGTGNEFAHSVAMAVANNPATTYNPLFIYGGVGLGKSHLLTAIGHFIYNKDNSNRVCYCSTEKFMHEMVNCIKLNKMELFREQYRNVDILLIDDIQFISRKERTQVEFFHTFNSLYESNKQIVITSDKFPRDIPDLEDRLRSRFEWGLIADIQPPDLETKIAILKKKADINKIHLPDDVAYYLASSDTRNIRELEGMLIRLGAYSSLQNKPINIEMAKNNLKDILIDKRKEITIELIQKNVADYFGIKLSELKSEKRYKNLVQARQIAIWLCRDMTSSSYPDIGAKFGGKDHSTVIHSTKKIERMIQENPNINKIINDIKETIK